MQLALFLRDFYCFSFFFVALLVRMQCNENRCTVLFMIAAFRVEILIFIPPWKLNFPFAFVRAP